MMRRISEYFAEVTRVPEPSPEQALWSSISSYDDEKVAAILEADVDVDAQDEDGWTALHRAASRNCNSTVHLLIDHGAAPSLPSVKGDTPLHEAAAHGFRTVCETLLLRGANPDARNENNKTPAEIARIYGHKDIGDMIQAYESLRQSRRIMAVRLAQMKPGV